MSVIGGVSRTCSDDEELNVTTTHGGDETLENIDVIGERFVGVDEEFPEVQCNEITPTVGMKFNDDNELLEFYKRYAFHVGFPVRKRSSRKGTDGSKCYVTYTCAREGRRDSSTSSSLKPQPSMQTGCQARVTAMVDVSGMWVVTKVLLEHNHQTSPSKSRLYRCNRKLSDQVKRRLEVNDIAGIPMHKSFNSTVVEAGGYNQMLFIEKDCRNYIDKVRRLRLGEGDATAIQSYFSKMQANCPGFFFNLDFDDECRLRNVFWCDNRCREAYKEFGDVVTFYTTYLTNRYDMPFAPFVGVNHHGHSILLGCGLLSNENTETFVWIFSTWLDCMEGKAPLGIITDQDRAMQNAIQIVFPKTRHRWCLWHILKKLPEKFGYHSQKAAILSGVHNVVYDSQTPEQFEEGWTSMIELYALHENNWLAGLYRERHRWVPCYLRTSFWAGMSTTQRSESINAFFDGYVHSKTSLKQFVEQYDRALRCKVEKEFHADFKSYSQIVPCVTKFQMEKQFQTAYTIAKFKEFQTEVTALLYCRVINEDVDSVGARYDVVEQIFFDAGEKKSVFNVLFKRQETEVICSCHLFEFIGILCRHAITVLRQNDVTTLPEKYILRRWRKDVCRHYTRVKINYNGWITTPEQVRYDQLCRVFGNVADVASEDEERTRRLMNWLQLQMNEMNISTSTPSMGGSNICNRLTEDPVAPQCAVTLISSTRQTMDPICSKTKGAPRKNRKKGPFETSKKIKVHSKGKKDKNKEQDVQPMSQSSPTTQFPTLTPYSYSQQGVTPWGGMTVTPPTYGINYLAPHPTNQELLSMYALPPRPSDD